jgi:hypothetical protein
LLLQPYDAGHSKLLFGTAFRYPGFYERYFTDGCFSQCAPKPGSPLQPERVYTAEIEHAHQVNDEVSITVAGYVSEMRNLIFIADIPTPLIGQPPGTTVGQYTNRPDPVHAAGGEIEVRWQAGPGWIFSGWYAYSLVREDPDKWFAGNAVPNSPSSTGAVRALFPLVPQTLSVSTEVIYGGPRHAIGDSGAAYGRLIGEQLLWNLGISGEYPRYGLRYGAFVDDLLDVRPLLPAGPEISFPDHGVPQYGRTLRLQLAASF